MKIYAIFKNGMAFAYCPGETINEQEIREPNFYISIARNLARVHNLSLSEIPKLDSPQWVVNTENFISKIKNFDQFVVEKPDDTCLYNQKYFQDRLSSLKNYQFKSKFNFQFSFCHNDLLGNNILFENFNDPNHPSQIANFIDYEYAGWNFCSFDVGNHFNEFCGTENIDYERDYPDLELRKKWASEYLKGRNLDENQVEISEEEIANFLADTEIMSLASHLMWGIWALFQHENTLLDDFDYKTYADERCGEMEKKAQKLGFEW